MARMKREEWYDIARDVDWTLSYADEEAVFPEWMTGAGKIPREAWKSWDEPYKCAYPDYVAGWLNKLRDDRKLLIHAAAQAQRAADYIPGRNAAA